jgi:glutamate synthase (ferredoxin)
MLQVEGDGPRSWAGIRNDRPQSRPALDEEWVEQAVAAVKRGEAFEVDSQIANKDRAVGARIAGEISVLRAAAESPMPTPSIALRFHGTAGQSFGAFAIEGMHLQLTGQANDFVGKGLCGGTLALRARGLAAKDSGQHVILGNVALYGATAGKLFAAGRAGERFAVRNSGAVTVVEGIGDHGCEYMTGGMAVVLGAIGLNFGAGMTGGTAWLLDVDGSVLAGERYHAEFLQAVHYSDAAPEAQQKLHALLQEHAAESESSLANQLLADWSNASSQFVYMTPLPQA